MNSSDIRHGAAIDIGHSRDKQEDAMLANLPLFVVADGLGGHRWGDVASRMVVEMLGEEIFEDREALPGAIQRANRAIYEAAETDHSLDGMGTTVVAMVTQEDSAQIAHVGDSRAYLLRDGEISRLTEDHSYVTRLVREGKLSEEEAEHHPQRNLVERALGQESEVEVDIQLIDTQPGDRFLLCTDGLTTQLSDPEIEDILSSVKSPQEASKRLVREALDAGGNDNVTVIVVDYPGGIGGGRASRQKRNRSARVALVALATVLLLTVLAFAARSAINNNYYVGTDKGNVAIFRGVPGSFAGLDLQEVERRTELDVKSLPDIWDSRLGEGLRADSISDAERIVARLRQLSSSSAPTSPP